MGIRLRPHHLLCVQMYGGKGYSRGFVENMDEIVGKLRGEEAVKIQLTFTTDDLCGSCPHKRGEGLCETDEKVGRFDRKVAEWFHLTEQEYDYQELADRIRDGLTLEAMEKICGECSWFAGICREKLTSA